jgi:hypothetical protein
MQWVHQEQSMFEGFALSMIDTGEALIRVRYGGSGPPLLLLHGHPQTHVMWYKIAPWLAEDFTVVAADLRGYGELSKWYDVLAIWGDWAEDLRGRALDCGHHLALEAPEETYAELYTFFY